MTPRRITQIAVAVLATAFAAAPSPPLGYPRKGAATAEESGEHQGVPARAYLEPERHVRNIGGSDGAGLCVFTSMQLTGELQGVDELKDMQRFMAVRPGGGYPEKVDAMLEQKLGPEHGVQYIHAYGDVAVDLLEQALTQGLYPCVTYGYGERYGVSINHMVNLAHLDAQWASVQDNNFPGTWEWMPRDEFVERFHWSTQGKGQGWAMIFLANPQPPRPKR